MEDIQRLSEPTPKDALRLILALAIYSTKPYHVSLTDYLTRLRIDAYARRYPQGPARHASELGGYEQLDPWADLMTAVHRLIERHEYTDVHPHWPVEEEDEEDDL